MMYYYVTFLREVLALVLIPTPLASPLLFGGGCSAASVCGVTSLAEELARLLLPLPSLLADASIVAPLLLLYEAEYSLPILGIIINGNAVGAATNQLIDVMYENKAARFSYCA